MNQQRRKEIEKLIAAIQDLATKRDEIRDGVDAIKSDEDEYRDNIPESLQGGEKYEQSETASDALQSAYDALDQLDFDGIDNFLSDALG